MDQVPVAVAHAVFEAGTKKMQEANEALKAISLKCQESISEKKAVNSELDDTVNVKSFSKKPHTTTGGQRKTLTNLK